MSFFYALVIPILILGLIYILIIENKGMPLWMERVSNNRGCYLDFWSHYHHTAIDLEVLEWQMSKNELVG